jgi:hypothetical protein
MLLPQQLRQLDQGDVHLLLDRRQNDVAPNFNPVRPLVATLRLGADHAGLSPFSDPADRACSCNAKSRCCRAPRQAAINRCNYASPQVFG